VSERGALIVGRCPGALRPMKSGDGLIVRVRPRLGRLSLAQLETLGGAAQRFGDGTLYLSNRANVQIRSVAAEAYPALLAVLRRETLIDSDPRIEAIRNVMVVPSVCSKADKERARALAARLEDLLARTEALYDLPGKFGIAVQAGGTVDTNAISDVTFMAGEDRITMMLEGELELAFPFDEMDRAVDGFLRLALAFLKLARQGRTIRRMRDAIKERGMEAIAREARLPLSNVRLPMSDARAPAGDLGEAFGMAFAFGEIPQAALAGTTGTMRRMGVAEAAVSPRRALVFAVSGENKAAFGDLARRVGAITDPADIRLRVHGCPGMPFCARATVPARRDAEKLLSTLEASGFPKGTVHISGCEKRCAFPHRADITAIGAGGRYMLAGSPDQRPLTIAQADLGRAVLELAEAL
jgi:precorrin-3B synthase